MVVGEIPEAVDLLVVGGGPGGYVAAIHAARLGREVTLVDADGLGGTCLTVGCIPSKALIELANHVDGRRLWASRHITADTETSVNLAAFRRWKNGVVDDLQGGVRDLLDHAGVDRRTGYFRFTRPDQGALVTDPDRPPTHLHFRSAIIATGSRPTELPHIPFDGRRVISSTEALDLDAVPTSLAVIGGGTIGVELGTAYAKLGSRVTIVELADRLLPEMPSSASRAVHRRLTELGVTIRLGARATGDDGAALTIDTDNGPETLAVDTVLVAVGRTPATDDLGLSAIGVQPGERGLIEVGPDLKAAAHIAAIGDITPGPALAHRASAQAEVAAAVLSGGAATFDPAAIPAVVFSDPEIAQTGMTLPLAQRAGYAARSARFPLAASGRARTLGDTSGSVEYLWDDETGIVLGATIIAPHASELIAEATLAIEMAAHLEDIAGTIHTHPTLAEAHHEAASLALGRPIHLTEARRHG